MLVLNLVLSEEWWDDKLDLQTTIFILGLLYDLLASSEHVGDGLVEELGDGLIAHVSRFGRSWIRLAKSH